VSSLTPEQFVANLIRTTVTTDRVAAVMARIAGERIEVGPLRCGPGGAVTATGVGLIGAIAVEPARGGALGFTAIVPGELTIDVTAGSGGWRHRYDGTVTVPMRIDVRLQPLARVLLDVAPLEPADVAVKLHTSGVATFVLQTLGDADGEVAAQVARIVNERVEAVADLRRIDLSALLNRAWAAEFESQPSSHSG